MKNASMTTAIAPGQNQGPLMSFFRKLSVPFCGVLGFCANALSLRCGCNPSGLRHFRAGTPNDATLNVPYRGRGPGTLLLYFTCGLKHR